jgi:hypothetical protein
VLGRVFALTFADRLPLIRDLADRYVVRTLRRRLAGYRRAEITTDHATYVA